MLASEMIVELQSLIDQYGDLPLTTARDGGEYIVGRAVVVNADPTYQPCDTKSKMHILIAERDV